MRALFFLEIAEERFPRLAEAIKHIDNTLGNEVVTGVVDKFKLSALEDKLLLSALGIKEDIPLPVYDSDKEKQPSGPVLSSV